MRVDVSGQRKGILGRGEHKSIQTDRVILVPGPDEEVETVRWIYSRFINDEKSESEIAAELNQRGINTDLGRDWTRGVVHQKLALSDDEYTFFLSAYGDAMATTNTTLRNAERA